MSDPTEEQRDDAPPPSTSAPRLVFGSHTEDAGAIANRALAIASEVMKRDGMPGADVVVRVHRRAAANVRFARNEPTTAGESDEIVTAIEVALGSRHAATSTNQLDDGAVAASAARALAMAKLSPEDSERMPLIGAQSYATVPSAWDDDLATMGPKVRAAIATRAIARGDQAKVQIAGFFEREALERVIASSAGLMARHRETSCAYTVTARTTDGRGSGWSGREAHRVRDVEDDLIASVAIDKALRTVDARSVPPGKYSVILEPQAVFELLAFLVQAMDQRSADEGRSFFANKVGQRLFAEIVSLRSDPADAVTPSAPFDDEGLPLTTHPWISEGRVNKLHVSRYWAKKKSLTPTGTHRTFHLSGGQADSTDELIKGTKRGLYVTRFWYNRMLEPQSIMVTGLTRDGLFLIEDGKITGPVTNFRFNESPITMLKNVDAMTRAATRVVSRGGVWQVPALRTHEFTMASPSAAV